MNLKRTRDLLIFTAVILLFSYLSINSVNADNLKHPLRVDARISTGKYIKINGSLPVTIDVTNMGENFVGKLQLMIERGIRSRSVVYYRDINIPKNGSKRYYLYMPRNLYYYVQPKISITRNNEYRDFTKLQFTRMQNNDRLVMILNKERGGLAYLMGFKGVLSHNASFYATYPEPDKLPVMWKGYDNVDFILINNLPSLNLGRKHEKAMLEYIATGGTLIFSSNLDPNEFNGSIFKDHIPIKSTGSLAIDNAPGATFIKSEVVVMGGKVDGEVIVKHGEIPLLIKKRYGLGWIYFLTADLSTRPFNQDYEQDIIWKAIYDDREGAKTANLTIDNQRILSNLPELASPPLGAIFWALLVYIILIGPVNYFYLKKKDKLMYLFLTVPLISILFSTGIFLLGYSTKGSKIIFRKFSIIYLPNKQSAGLNDTIISLFSPSKTSYDISLLDPTATGWEMGNRYDLPRTLTRENEVFTLEDLRVDMWSMRQFKAVKSQKFKGPLEMDVKTEDNFFKGVIHNRTGKILNKCVLYYRGNISPSFDLPTGSKDISFPAAKQKLASHSLARYLIDSYNLKKGSNKKDPMKNARINAINAICDIMLRSSGNKVILLGWSNDDTLKTKLNKKGAKVYNVNLFFVR
ncbi:MAG: hypothetical protein K8T10_04350 [Candidatus Eremiobacteraeota bacterium]|nr:hypothetical protein [Candidatus Eremiobacteraeota bacterium]